MLVKRNRLFLSLSCHRFQISLNQTKKEEKNDLMIHWWMMKRRKKWLNDSLMNRVRVVSCHVETLKWKIRMFGWLVFSAESSDGAVSAELIARRRINFIVTRWRRSSYIGGSRIGWWKGLAERILSSIEEEERSGHRSRGRGLSATKSA